MTKNAERRLKFQGIQAATQKPDVEWRENLSNFNERPVRQVGNNGRSRSRQRIRKPGPSPEELHWRESVLLRDNYTCTHCGSKEKLEADHIKPRYLYPDLRLDIDNGRTLCHSCHTKTETYGSKVKRIVDVKQEPLTT